MSFLNVAAPAINFANVARPLIAMGFLGTLVIVFEPLLLGLLRAGLLVLRPRASRDERQARKTLRAHLMLDRMAADADSSDPALAAELRSLAARA